MIHTLLNLTRPLFVVDCETTGVDAQNDRIIEIGFQEWNADGMVKEWRSLVNPGVPIPAASVAIHHIDPTIMDKCSKCYGEKDSHGSSPSVCDTFHPIPFFRQLAANLAKGFSNCDFAGKNVRFDLRILSAEMARAGVEWSYVGARIVDAERLEQLAVPRSLSHLYEKYAGHKHDGAHGALSDVRASTTVIVHQLQTHLSLPQNLDALHRLQWPGWIDSEGKFRFVNGIACFSQWGKHANKPMASVDPSYWKFILDKDFSADVKAIARAAKLGQFPVEAK